MTILTLKTDLIEMTGQKELLKMISNNQAFYNCYLKLAWFSKPFPFFTYYKGEQTLHIAAYKINLQDLSRDLDIFFGSKRLVLDNGIEIHHSKIVELISKHLDPTVSLSRRYLQNNDLVDILLENSDGTEWLQISLKSYAMDSDPHPVLI